LLQIVSIFSKHDNWDVLFMGVYMILVLIAKACLGRHDVAQSMFLVAWLNSACHFPYNNNSNRKASTHHEIGHPKKKPIKIEQRMTIINPKINHSIEDGTPLPTLNHST
jgi:hypothetical protein